MSRIISIKDTFSPACAFLRAGIWRSDVALLESLMRKTAPSRLIATSCLAAAANWLPIDLVLSIYTNLQIAIILSNSACSSSTKPCNIKGDSIQGLSSSDTNMPSESCVTSIFSFLISIIIFCQIASKFICRKIPQTHHKLSFFSCERGSFINNHCLHISALIPV